MLKKRIKYTDYNGVEREEDFYFNLSKAEVAEMELEVKGGLSAKIQQIVDADNRPELIRIFKDLIVRSYGVKSLDGKRFVKTDEIRDEFLQSEAYSELFMELATNANAASEFINGIVPQTNDAKPAIPAPPVHTV